MRASFRVVLKRWDFPNLSSRKLFWGASVPPFPSPIFLFSLLCLGCGTSSFFLLTWQSLGIQFWFGLPQEIILWWTWRHSGKIWQHLTMQENCFCSVWGSFIPCIEWGMNLLERVQSGEWTRTWTLSSSPPPPFSNGLYFAFGAREGLPPPCATGPVPGSYHLRQVTSWNWFLLYENQG